MTRLDLYIKPHHGKTIALMNKMRGTTSRSEFILNALQYMIDTHTVKDGMLVPINQPVLADDWEIWQKYFQELNLYQLVDSIKKLEQMMGLAKQVVEQETYTPNNKH